MLSNRVGAAGAVIGYLACIVAGVWAVDAIGVIPVGFGLMAPAAVLFVGLALVFRDLVQEALGLWATFVAVLIGAAISLFISPTLAVASGAAFLVSEAFDLLIYSGIRQRHGIIRGVLGSNAVSIIVDSLVFLWLAFGSFAFLPGQIIGKVYGTLAAVAMLLLIHRKRERLA